MTTLIEKNALSWEIQMQICIKVEVNDGHNPCVQFLGGSLFNIWNMKKLCSWFEVQLGIYDKYVQDECC